VSAGRVWLEAARLHAGVMLLIFVLCFRCFLTSVFPFAVPGSRVVLTFLCAGRRFCEFLDGHTALAPISFEACSALVLEYSFVFHSVEHHQGSFRSC
jgi:hypothetical protein